jgi:NadR type nicotinamide-nucleotide adenylyltransferase
VEKKNGMSIKRIVLIGPESTGKTELAKMLAKEFDTVYIPEYAREYIEKLNRKYTYSDIEKIAKKQIALETEIQEKANGVLFYDTFLIITKIWFQLVFNKIPDWIDSRIKSSDIDLFLLCNTDLTWIEDSVRENGGEKREYLFDLYKTELEKYNFEYKIISGVDNKRNINALRIVKDYLNGR